MKAPVMKKGALKKAPPLGSKGKMSEAPEMPVEGDAAPRRADRMARKSGGSVKKGC